MTSLIPVAVVLGLLMLAGLGLVAYQLGRLAGVAEEKRRVEEWRRRRERERHG
jgi:hypothetical protein